MHTTPGGFSRAVYQFSYTSPSPGYVLMLRKYFCIAECLSNFIWLEVESDLFTLYFSAIKQLMDCHLGHTPPQCRCHKRSCFPQNNKWRDKEGKMPKKNNGERKRGRCEKSMHVLKFNLPFFTSPNSQLWENGVRRFNKKIIHNCICIMYTQVAYINYKALCKLMFIVNWTMASSLKLIYSL